VLGESGGEDRGNLIIKNGTLSEASDQCRDLTDLAVMGHVSITKMACREALGQTRRAAHAAMAWMPDLVKVSCGGIAAIASAWGIDTLRRRFSSE